MGPKTPPGAVAAVDDGAEFKNERQLAVWIGLLFREFSSGPRTILMRISKRGNQHLRGLLAHCARAVMRTAPCKANPANQWVNPLWERFRFNRGTVAVANENSQYGRTANR